MKTYFFNFRGVTKHYPCKDEAERMAVFCGISKSEVKQAEMSINWKN